MEKLLDLSKPKYEHLKSTFEVFDKRINFVNSRKYILYTERNVTHLNRMKNIRERVLNLLKSHKLYNELEFIFKERSDPIFGEIPDETLKTLANLSKPRMRDLKSTLIKINQMIRALTDDYFFKENTLKFKRFNELMEYRKNICCMISHYKLASDRPICIRFAPCKKKYINIWEIPTDKRPNSRILKFDFDKKTNQLSYPRRRYVQCTLNFFYNLYYYYVTKLNENPMWTQNEINQFNSAIQIISQRIQVLQELSKKYKVEEFSNISCGIPKIPEAKAKLNGPFVSFTNSIELPSKRRLYSAYEFYSSYLSKLKKNEAIKKPDTAHATIVGTKSYIERVQRNILFIENLLKELSNDEDDVDSAEEKKFLKHIYDESGRVCQYVFDEKTNQMSSPKLAYLENALEMQFKIMERYEYDMKNIDNELTPKTNEFKEKRRTKSLSYAELLKRVNRLRDLVSQKKEIVENLQKTPPKPGFPTNFYHHKACLDSKFEEPTYKKYEMKGPYVSITTSMPSEHRLLNSLFSYEKWIQMKMKDIRYKQEIASILSNQKDEDDSCESVRVLQHTRKMIGNKAKLEMQLDVIKSNVQDNDSHFQAHQKLDESSEYISRTTKTDVDYSRIFSLALPKKSMLICSLLQYSHLMSENKRKHIACKLFKDFSKPEQIEMKLRQNISKKNRRLKPKSNDYVIVSQLFDNIIKENLIPFEKLIQFSVFKALNFQHSME